MHKRTVALVLAGAASTAGMVAFQNCTGGVSLALQLTSPSTAHAGGLVRSQNACQGLTAPLANYRDARPDSNALPISLDVMRTASPGAGATIRVKMARTGRMIQRGWLTIMPLKTASFDRTPPVGSYCDWAMVDDRRDSVPDSEFPKEYLVQIPESSDKLFFGEGEYVARYYEADSASGSGWILRAEKQFLSLGAVPPVAPPKSEQPTQQPKLAKAELTLFYSLSGRCIGNQHPAPEGFAKPPCSTGYLELSRQLESRNQLMLWLRGTDKAGKPATGYVSYDLWSRSPLTQALVFDTNAPTRNLSIEAAPMPDLSFRAISVP